jgi:PHP family Zn ribbon phosphoesterase
MSPRVIVARAKELGLDLIALSDHNSALNLPALETLCRRENLACLFGIEACTREEAHILLLFKTCAEALEMGEFLYRLLPEVPNLPEVTGDQVYVDADDVILGEVEKLLISGAEISLEDLLKEVHRRGGLYIPAHIDRFSFSIVSQLGFLPKLDYDALESTVLPCPVPQYGLPVIRNSDAHYVEDIGKRSTLYEMEEPGFEGLKEFLRRGR